MPPTHTPAAPAVAWLERGYGRPDAFKYPVFEGLHTPYGLFQVKPNHIGDCFCETGKGEFWLAGDAAAKWRAS